MTGVTGLMCVLGQHTHPMQHTLYNLFKPPEQKERTASVLPLRRGTASITDPSSPISPSVLLWSSRPLQGQQKLFFILFCKEKIKTEMHLTCFQVQISPKTLLQQ